MPADNRSSEDGKTEDMIAIQSLQQQQLNAFNARFSSIWSERMGNSALSQVNIQDATTQDATKYSCFQLSPIGAPPMMNRFPPPQNQASRPRLPPVVERALAPKPPSRQLQPPSASRRTDRSGSPMIMERFLSDYQEVRETRSEQRRQQRSPPQQFSFVSPDLVERAQSTRELVGERFLRSLDQASILSPELEMAMRMVNGSLQDTTGDRSASSRERPVPSSPPVPLTRKNFEIIESRRPRERHNSTTEMSTGRSRRSKEVGDRPSKLDQAIRESIQGNSRYRSSSVPGNTRKPHQEPPSAPTVDVFPTSLRRSETQPEKLPRASSTHSTRRTDKVRLSEAATREIRFTEVRSLREVPRPQSTEPVASLSSIQQSSSRASHRPPVDDRIDEAEEHSQAGWDGSQCSEDDRDGCKSPIEKLVGMFSQIPADLDEDEIIAIQDLHPQRKSLLTMLPQPLKVSRLPNSTGKHPKFQFERSDGSPGLPKDLIASRGEELHIIPEQSSVAAADEERSSSPEGHRLALD